ncbi:DUF4389 domain-containing protein [Pseudonocardia sp. H11422]|uniref:DUF4389 domain-containing protein n=1 Tax=Pseudonocardia sp. H11422 TaxID=2835866 RepID=UPI0027E250BC|nr:DUF4389 domain-containing protein [Pseudonocardia sp. H11422]
MSGPDVGMDPTARWLAGLAAALVGLLAIGLLGAGALLMWAQNLRDDDGFFSTPVQRLGSDGVAVTGGELRPELGAVPFGIADLAGEAGTVRVRVTTLLGDPVFVGIGPREDVADYLRGASRDEIVEIGPEPNSAVTRRYDGMTVVPPPGRQLFWVAAAEGLGTQTVLWPVAAGDHSLVIMNADGERSVSVDAIAARRIPYLTPIAVVLMFIGVLLLGGALLLGISAWTGHPIVQPAGRPPEAADWAYPARIEARLDEPLSRWLWLVKWALLIPHLVVLAVLWTVFVVLTLVAAVAILATERYPKPIFDVNVGVLRWTWRVAYYGYWALGTDRYPPFTLAPADYPATLTVAHPPRLTRALVIFVWLLAAPHVLVVVLLVGLWGPLSGGVPPFGVGGLVVLLTLVAGVALTVRGRYPRDLFDLNVGLDRWTFRVLVYLALMTDEYPPFRLDSGAVEPVAVAIPAPRRPGETASRPAREAPRRSEAGAAEAGRRSEPGPRTQTDR